MMAGIEFYLMELQFLWEKTKKKFLNFSKNIKTKQVMRMNNKILKVFDCSYMSYNSIQLPNPRGVGIDRE